MAAWAVNNTVFSFSWKTTICPCWNAKICYSLFWPLLGTLKQDKYDYSVHTRQSKNTQLKSWKLFSLTLGRKFQVPFSFAQVFSFLGRSFTSQSPPVVTLFSHDLFRVALGRGEEAVSSVIAEAADRRARDTRYRRSSPELGRRDSSLRRKSIWFSPLLTHTTEETATRGTLKRHKL